MCMGTNSTCSPIQLFGGFIDQPTHHRGHNDEYSCSTAQADARQAQHIAASESHPCSPRPGTPRLRNDNCTFCIPPHTHAKQATSDVSADLSHVNALWMGAPEVQAGGLQHRQLQQQLQGLVYRPLQLPDLEALRVAHTAVFPIDYDNTFYQAAVQGCAGIFSWVAVLPGCGAAPDIIVGFVTARLLHLREVDRLERVLMGLDGVTLDHERVAYVLTLGVAPVLRGQGLASHLIQLLVHSAHQHACLAVYLHVLDFNHVAMKLYAKHHFVQRGLLQDFYLIQSGRRPDPNRTVYNAYLCCRCLRDIPGATAASCLLAATAPFRALAHQLGSTCAAPWRTPAATFGQYDVQPHQVIPLGPAAAALQAWHVATQQQSPFHPCFCLPICHPVPPPPPAPLQPPHGIPEQAQGGNRNSSRDVSGAGPMGQHWLHWLFARQASAAGLDRQRQALLKSHHV